MYSNDANCYVCCTHVNREKLCYCAQSYNLFLELLLYMKTGSTNKNDDSHGFLKTSVKLPSSKVACIVYATDPCSSTINSFV